MGLTLEGTVFCLDPLDSRCWCQETKCEVPTQWVFFFFLNMYSQIFMCQKLLFSTCKLLTRFASIKIQLSASLSLYKCKKLYLFMKYELNYTVVFFSHILAWVDYALWLLAWRSSSESSHIPLSLQTCKHDFYIILYLAAF